MIKDFIENLILLDEEDWGRYAFGREPLVGKLSSEQLQMYYRNASECGINLARSIRSKYQGKSVKECAELEGAKVQIADIGQDGILTIFATFTEPDTITVFKNNADRTDEVIEEEGLSEKLGAVTTADLLLAHELFHYIELMTPEIYTRQKHLTLFKFWKIINRSRIMCLEEIGAMAFAKEFTGLRCSPYLYDILMLYCCNPQKARMQYENMMEFLKEADK